MSSTAVLKQVASVSNAQSQYEAALTAVSAPSFKTARAREKQGILWGFISRFPYEQLPSAYVSDFTTISRLMSRPFLQKAFILDEDVRPPRMKAFHSYGTVAKMRFVADGKHPFTGIFASGAAGFVRASLAVGMPKYSPAAAFKFLIDGAHPSENLLLHQSLDIQASRDFFERAPTNYTLLPVMFPNTLMLKFLRFWLSPISKPIEIQRLDHLAEVTCDGTAVQQPFAPELVYFYGAEEVRNDPASQEDFRDIVGAIPPGALLYRVYGKVSRRDKQVYIGSITTESSFVASEFGDRILAFKHAWGSKDPPA